MMVDAHYKTDRKYRFWFHFNKPATQREGKPQISVHYRNRCLIVDNVVCNVPTHGKINEKRQPKFVMRGKTNDLEIKDNVVYIN